MTLLIHHGTVYTPHDRIEDGAVLVRDGLIAAVGHARDVPAPAGTERVDARGNAIIPGLIDLHTYGCKGAQLTRPDRFADELRALARNYAEFGVTGFLISPPIAPSATPEEMADHLAVLAGAIEAAHTAPEPGAAVCLGIHLEGPCLDPRQPGTFPVRRLQQPSPASFTRWLDAARGAIRLVTLAPNVPGAADSARLLRGRGVRVSLGHTSTNYEGARAALSPRGDFDIVTHMFNAMTGLGHREPGVVGAVLESDVPVMLINDGIHVHPAVVKVLLRAKTAERVVLVTDSIAAAGLGDGEYSIFDIPVTVRHGRATNPSGTLAGSALTLNRAVLNAVLFAGLPFGDAVAMATANPAAILGLEDRGVLTAGARGDVVLMSEATGEARCAAQA